VLGIVEETIRAITPHVLGLDAVEELPEADPQATVDYINDWFEKGIPEYRLLTNFAFLQLNLYSLIRKGRLFPRLDYQSQARLMESLAKAKGVLVNEFLYLIGIPAVNSYYSRVDVQKLLGFDIVALKEESELRSVTRNGGPLPPKDAPAEASPQDTVEGEK
jgi:NAD-dependent DNA ligase